MRNRTIKKLKDRYDRINTEKLAKEEKERPFKERIQAIFSAPRFIVTDFFCPVCKRDCTGTGYRQVQTFREWAPTAWYLGICPNGHRMIRRITDKETDPYYDLSPIITRQRYELRDALLTPDDPRFKILYPKQWEKLYGNTGQKT